MSGRLQDYSNMVNSLGKGRFSEEQSVALVHMLEKMFPEQYNRFVVQV